jgi:hypothetical protein
MRSIRSGGQAARVITNIIRAVVTRVRPISLLQTE